MILRTAAIDDLALVKHWDEQPHVIASDDDDDWNWEEELPKFPSWREQLIAEENGVPIGFIQIIDPALEESHYWGKVAPNLRAIDIWIGEEYNLNKGYGTTMMKMAFERCFKPPNVTAILIDPLAKNTKAHRFYERLGFQFIEERLFDDTKCFVYQLTRNDWKKRMTFLE